jgi:hypothetical protein
MGRKSKYQLDYCEQVTKLCRLGATDQEIANFFKVNEDTINVWKKQYKEFFAAIKEGKIQADAEVADRLYMRAIGYEHNEDKIFIYEGRPIIVPTIKRYPPDTTAAIFWLKNRQPKLYREKQELDINKNLDNLSDEDLIKLAKAVINENKKTNKNEGEQPAGDN